jgi:hypothetical protein
MAWLLVSINFKHISLISYKHLSVDKKQIRSQYRKSLLMTTHRYQLEIVICSLHPLLRNTFLRLSSNWTIIQLWDHMGLLKALGSSSGGFHGYVRWDWMRGFAFGWAGFCIIILLLINEDMVQIQQYDLFVLWLCILKSSF